MLFRSDDGIDGAGITAVVAADACGFVDDCDSLDRRGRQRLGIASQEASHPADRILATRRAEVDCGRTVDHGGGIRATPGVTTLRALGLRQEVIHLLHEVAVRWRQAAVRIGQADAGDSDFTNLA